MSSNGTEELTGARALSEGAQRGLSVLVEGVGAAMAFAPTEEQAPRPGRDRRAARDQADVVWEGLVTVILRLTFLLFAEARELSPRLPGAALSVRRLQQQLRASADTPNQQVGAWQRLCRHFRALFDKATAADSPEPASAAALFDPSAYPFLEGHPSDDAAGGDTALFSDELVLQVLEALTATGTLDFGSLDVAHLGTVYEALMTQRLVRVDDRLVLEPSAARRRSGSHYTPTSLSRPIVERTLEPLLACMGEEPASNRILGLAVCDPAMGGGAFLLQTCCVLAEQLVVAWRREGAIDAVVRRHGDASAQARLEVGQSCLYGVDNSLLAVRLAKLSLWLLIADDELPWSNLDHALQHGDSLVGLSLEQMRAFHWQPRPPLPSLERWLSDAERGKQRAQLVGDVLVGAYFGQRPNKARELERTRRLALLERWVSGDDEAERELWALQAELRRQLPVFHWPLRMPEIFQQGRADPLRKDSRLVRGMDAVVGNPPFLGGKRISTELGDAFADWLRNLHGASKNVDLAAHFFRRANTLVAERGTIGLIATNTLAEGDTRRDGLRYLLSEAGLLIYDAVRSRPWPGEAAVHMAVVHLAKQMPADVLRVRLDNRDVEHVSSMLRPTRERPEAASLAASRGLCFIGCFLRGRGFVLQPSEAEPLLRRGDNGQRLRPFLGGEEVNRSPVQDFCRYVIDFDDLSLQESRNWPELLEIVRQRVRPRREQLKDHGVDLGHKRRWWQFANPRPELRAALAPLSRCLVAPRVTKHLSFAFQPIDRVMSDQLCVFALEDHAGFAILQSRVHESWARLHASTLGEGLRYTPSDCVETFAPPTPWRQPDPDLAAAGQRLYDARARYLELEQLGLTQAYNRLAAPRCDDEPVRALRQLHEETDRAVLDAYGWTDLAVPPYCPRDEGERDAIELFRGEIVERLYRLNAEQSKTPRP